MEHIPFLKTETMSKFQILVEAIVKNIVRFYDTFQLSLNCNISLKILHYFSNEAFIDSFHAGCAFLCLLKTSETSDFLMFLGDIERDQCHEINCKQFRWKKSYKTALKKGVLIKFCEILSKTSVKGDLFSYLIVSMSIIQLNRSAKQLFPS